MHAHHVVTGNKRYNWGWSKTVNSQLICTVLQIKSFIVAKARVCTLPSAGHPTATQYWNLFSLGKVSRKKKKALYYLFWISSTTTFFCSMAHCKVKHCSFQAISFCGQKFQINYIKKSYVSLIQTYFDSLTNCLLLSSSFRTFLSCRNSWCFSSLSWANLSSSCEICSLVSPRVITSCFCLRSRSFRWRSTSASASCSERQ